jgi:hypothetical protein
MRERSDHPQTSFDPEPGIPVQPNTPLLISGAASSSDSSSLVAHADPLRDLGVSPVIEDSPSRRKKALAYLPQMSKNSPMNGKRIDIDQSQKSERVTRNPRVTR